MWAPAGCPRQDDDDRRSQDGGAGWDADDSEAEEVGDADDGDEDAKPVFLAPSEVEAQLRALWRVEKAVVARVWGRTFASAGAGAAAGGATDYSQFFIRCLLVPPNKFRPPQKSTTGDGMFEHVQNMFYTKVLNFNAALVTAGVGPKPVVAEDEDGDGRLPELKPVDLAKVLNVWIELQDAVNRLMDSSKALTYEGLNANSGIRQVGGRAVLPAEYQKASLSLSCVGGVGGWVSGGGCAVCLLPTDPHVPLRSLLRCNA